MHISYHKKILVMKPNFHSALQPLVWLLLLVLFIVPMKGSSQSAVNTYPLERTDPSAKTDVSAFLVRDINSQKYRLTVANPSRRKLKICF